MKRQSLTALHIVAATDSADTAPMQRVYRPPGIAYGWQPARRKRNPVLTVLMFLMLGAALALMWLPIISGAE